ncbi:MAG: zinc ABC transporter substrate-binding protein [Phascolarctobacterium sp.]|nr:zinc ABC transporter substrate-binding protein [Phascolarctobacterium sp.]
MKKIFFLILAITICLTGCSSPERKAAGKLSVVASFYPMAEFARAVGGDKIDIVTLVPDGAEPHDWEPSPRDLTRLGRAKVFVYNGIVEPWADTSLEALKERKIFGVEAGRNLFLVNGKQDPHVWISPRKAMKEVQAICQAFSEVDAKNAATYEKNAANYLSELQKLDTELVKISQAAKRKSFVTSHRAFGHLAADYGLTQISISGISPESEPNPRDLKNLVNLVRKENVKYIFFETLASPKLAEMLAKETGAQSAVLDPIEGLDEEGKKAGVDYLKIQKENVEALRKALCE